MQTLMPIVVTIALPCNNVIPCKDSGRVTLKMLQNPKLSPSQLSRAIEREALRQRQMRLSKRSILAGNNRCTLKNQKMIWMTKMVVELIYEINEELPSDLL